MVKSTRAFSTELTVTGWAADRGFQEMLRGHYGSLHTRNHHHLIKYEQHMRLSFILLTAAKSFYRYGTRNATSLIPPPARRTYRATYSAI